MFVAADAEDQAVRCASLACSLKYKLDGCIREYINGLFRYEKGPMMLARRFMYVPAICSVQHVKVWADPFQCLTISIAIEALLLVHELSMVSSKA